MTKRDFQGDMAVIAREEVQKAAQYMGLGPQVCADLAAKVEEGIRLRGGKGSAYIAKVDRKRRDAQIRDASKRGDSDRAIADAHGLTERRVQQILRGA